MTTTSPLFDEFPNAQATALSRAHYQDAWLYDRLYGRRRLEVDFYKGLASGVENCLEMGAGTGRLTFQLLKVCQRVWAVERESALIDQLIIQAARLPDRTQERLRYLQTDISHFKKPERFDLIVLPFHVLSHALTENELYQWLKVVARHLTKHGRMAFDIPYPSSHQLSLPTERRYRVGHLTGPLGERFARYESFEYDALSQRQLTTFYFDYISEAHPQGDIGHPASFMLPLLQRHFYPQELRRCVEGAGFTILQHDGSFQGETLTHSSQSQVVVARLRDRE